MGSEEYLFIAERLAHPSMILRGKLRARHGGARLRLVCGVGAVGVRRASNSLQSRDVPQNILKF